MSRKRQHRNTLPNFSNSLLDNALAENTDAYYCYLERLVNMWLVSLKYENLPETIDPRFLNMTLLYNGSYVVFEDELLGLVAMKYTMSGGFDIYEIPNKRHAYTVNGPYKRTLDHSNSVIVYNNYLRSPSFYQLSRYAERLAKIDRTIDSNASLLKFGAFIQCEESQLLTMKNLMAKWDGNDPITFGDPSLDLDTLKVLKFDVPNNTLELQTLKKEIWVEALNFIGIEAFTSDKKERLVANETGGNDGNIESCRNTRLESAIESWDKINKMFGTNVIPKWNSTLNSNVNTDLFSPEDIERGGLYE